MNKSKTMILLALLIVVSVLASCTKDKDDDPSIFGTWNMVSSVSEEFINGVSEGKTDKVVNDKNFNKITLKSDNTYSFSYSSTYMFNGTEIIESDTYTGTYTYKDDILALTFDIGTEDEDTELYSYSLESNQLILTETMEYQI